MGNPPPKLRLPYWKMWSDSFEYGLKFTRSCRAASKGCLVSKSKCNPYRPLKGWFLNSHHHFTEVSHIPDRIGPATWFFDRKGHPELAFTFKTFKEGLWLPNFTSAGVYPDSEEILDGWSWLGKLHFRDESCTARASRSTMASGFYSMSVWDIC